jgi:hypothetical protein
MAHRPIPTIHEFVLRAIQIGEGTADGIAHFLGLEVDLIEAVLRVLRTDALIAFAESEPEGGRRHVLTEFGSERLIEEPIVQKIALAQVTATCDPLMLVAARNLSRGARHGVACAVGRNGSRRLLSGPEASDCS